MVKKFPDQPNIKPIFCTDRQLSGQCYELQHPYYFETDREKHIIPSGFIYDGASIPRLVWGPLGVTPDGLHRAAALIHDYLYMNKANFSYTRKEVDDLFLRQMLMLGMPRRRARLMHRGVRLFGWTMGGGWPKGE
jgi:hypothetical protein